MPEVIHSDVEKCIACRTCEMSCALAHSQSKDLIAAMKERPRPGPRLHVTAVEDDALTVQCRHCENPPCVAVCPVEALAKAGPDEPVIMDLEKCIRCRLCAAVCPFGSITLSADRINKQVLKCDLCEERVAEGLGPACLEACPTGAISLQVRQTTVAEKERSGAMPTFEIDEEACTGCHLCGRNCPAEAIAGKAKEKHKIDPEKCIQCGQCHELCRFGAVQVKLADVDAKEATCEACGSSFALAAVLEGAVARLGYEPEKLYTCPACRRKLAAEAEVGERVASGA